MAFFFPCLKFFSLTLAKIFLNSLALEAKIKSTDFSLISLNSRLSGHPVIKTFAVQKIIILFFGSKDAIILHLERKLL